MPAQHIHNAKIAFDIDGTLIRQTDYGSAPRYEIINLLLWFNKNCNEVYVWSGSGLDYAKTWSEKLGITCAKAIPKNAEQGMDIAFDDEEVLLAKVNIQV